MFLDNHTLVFLMLLAKKKQSKKNQQLSVCVFLDVVSVLSPLLQNLPPLPSSELTDPHDDTTLPRLIEALQHRHRIKQMMFDEYSRAGTCTQLSASSDVVLIVLTGVVFFKPTL